MNRQPKPAAATHEDPAEVQQVMRDAFGERLRKLMEARGFESHAALARSSGVERSMITRLINGERRVNGDQIAKLAVALSVPPADLWARGIDAGAVDVSGTGTMPADPQGSHRLSDPSRTSVPQHHAGGGYVSKYIEAGIVAEEMDSIQDPACRRLAMAEAIAQIRKTLAAHHPPEQDADQGPDRALRR